MLHDSNLAQLKQLKQQLEDDKEYAEGIVKSTQRRFGFVVTDDGREIYLAPDEMDKVFPGDRVTIQIFTQQPAASGKQKKKNAPKAKVSGQLMKLLASPLTEFTGRYVVKGKGHFVEPDLPNMNRWVFVPPAKRKEAKDGDFIRCKITKHPYPQAKPQAAIIEVIGPLEQPGIEVEYAVNKFQLDQPWPQDWQQSLAEPSTEGRDDLTEQDFVTIDSPSTVDMDDALLATATESGWKLSVAIADASERIIRGSPLEQFIERRATSVYFPGRAISMLPPELSNDCCSLLPQQSRPVLVCTMAISTSGEIEDYRFSEALICSRDKLSYHDVAGYLAAPGEQWPGCHRNADTLDNLQRLSEALLAARQRNNLVHKGRPNFRLLLNNKRKLESIDIVGKSSSHSLVEECMVAANRCASDFLGDQGLFIAHAGFRQERVADVKKLAQEQLGIDELDPVSLAGYRQLINSIDDDAIEFPIRSVLSRLLERSKLTTKSSAHFGMGLESYTTFTSPIRKYSDFLVHRIIKQKLRSEPLTVPEQQQLDSLQQTLDRAHQARTQIEQQLKCQFMKPLVGQNFRGEVSQINSNGFTVRVQDHNIEGFVDTRLLPQKYSFDPMRLRLSSKALTVELEQHVDIVVSEVDIDRRTIAFSLPASEASAG